MLENKLIVITGGCGLIGRQFVKTIVLNHATAIIADVDEAAAKQVVAELDSNRVVFHKTDISSEESVRRLISRIDETYGKIDALVNNAYPRGGLYGKKLEEVTLAGFNENMNLHLGGYFLCMKEFSLYFHKQGHGNVVNMASIYGVIAPRFQIYDNTEMTMPVEYAAIKAGIIHLTKYFMRYFSGCNIRYNSISPGGVFNGQSPQFVENYRNAGPGKGMLDGKDLDGTLLFLLSDLSAYVNGQNIIVDDGWSI